MHPTDTGNTEQKASRQYFIVTTFTYSLDMKSIVFYAY